MVVLEGIVIFILAAYAFFTFAPPIILDIIWIKRVKSGKSEKFGPLGIISIIVTVGSLMSLPKLFTMIGEYYGNSDREYYIMCVLYTDGFYYVKKANQYAI